MDLSALFRELRSFGGVGAFNQYAQVDADLDVPGADGIRLDNLRAYLETFRAARFVLVGEAPSFHGCRFSGIPFTAEEQLVGASPLWWAKDGVYKRTSRRARLMSEHSGSIVWECLGKRRDVVLWNAFPWHSHMPGDVTKNRKPTTYELEKASGVLRSFIGIFPGTGVYAVGRTAERALGDIGIAATYIRHPARGGKPAFMAGVAGIAG
jgi:uracil-DNA glycosylase